jgi:hypothetical protein
MVESWGLQATPAVIQSNMQSGFYPPPHLSCFSWALAGGGMGEVPAQLHGQGQRNQPWSNSWPQGVAKDLGVTVHSAQNPLDSLRLGGQSAALQRPLKTWATQVSKISPSCFP